MKKIVFSVTALFLCLPILLSAAEKTQTTCPITGEKINKTLYVDHNGKRIYVCCRGCIGKVKKAPQKYIKKLEAQGIKLVATPKKTCKKCEKIKGKKKCGKCGLLKGSSGCCKLPKAKK